jgi:heme-degrading monooxygenase HmoA
MLVTAHWDSPAQHAECIASEANQRAMAAIGSLAVPSLIKVFHVEDVQMFSTVNEGPLSVLRIGVEPGRETKELVERIWNDGVKGLLSGAAGYEHTAGWRIEKEGEGREEFVVVGAWRDEDSLQRFLDESWDKAWREVRVLAMDAKSYRRIAY